MTPTVHEAPHGRAGIIVGLMVTLLLAALDQTIVGTAMPRIIEQLHGFERYPWVTTGYLLASTLAVPIFGKLSDLYGRKWIYMGGTLLFVVASGLCGAAGHVPLPLDGMNQLILFRAVQGIGGGIMMGLSFTIIGDIFAPAERGRYQGLFASVFGLASIIGPTVGGWITDSFSWRWTFYVNAPVGLVALVVLYATFPHIVPRHVRRVIDYAGIASLASGLVPLLVALTLVNERGWTSPLVVALLSVATVMTAVFLWVEARAVEPILPLGLFTDRAISLAIFSNFFLGLGMFSVILYVPLFLQGVQGLSATVSGQLFTPMMLTNIVTSTIAGLAISKTGRYKGLAVAGTVILIFGMALLSMLPPDATRMSVIAALVVCGLGMGAGQPVYTLVVQNSAPPGQMGAATAAVTFFRSIGSTLGVAAFGTLLLMQYHAGLGALPPEVRGQVSDPLRFTRDHDALAQTLGTTRFPEVLQVVTGSLAHSLHLVFLSAALTIVLVMAATVFLPERPLSRTLERPPASET